MIAYKGFNLDMTCRGFQFEEGKTYEEAEAQLCRTGFHACEAPIDVLHHYGPTESVYHQVNLEDIDPARGDTDSKMCGRKITIGRKLTARELCELQLVYIKEHCTGQDVPSDQHNAIVGHHEMAIASYANLIGGAYSCVVSNFHGTAITRYCSASYAGDYGVAVSGERGAAMAGEGGTAISNDDGIAMVGPNGISVSGEYGLAVAGECGISVSRNGGIASTGAGGIAAAKGRGVAIAGFFGTAISRHYTKVGQNGVGVAKGRDVKVSGGHGAMLTIAEEDRDGQILWSKSFIIDGEEYLADTWYRFNSNGELIEDGSSKDFDYVQ